MFVLRFLERYSLGAKVEFGDFAVVVYDFVAAAVLGLLSIDVGRLVEGVLGLSVDLATGAWLQAAHVTVGEVILGKKKVL
jgi:hypothetical protein